VQKFPRENKNAILDGGGGREEEQKEGRRFADTTKPIPEVQYELRPEENMLNLRSFLFGFIAAPKSVTRGRTTRKQQKKYSHACLLVMFTLVRLLLPWLGGG
jgi:hypothetical protein